MMGKAEQAEFAYLDVVMVGAIIWPQFELINHGRRRRLWRYVFFVEARTPFVSGFVVHWIFSWWKKGEQINCSMNGSHKMPPFP